MNQSWSGFSQVESVGADPDHTRAAWKRGPCVLTPFSLKDYNFCSNARSNETGTGLPASSVVLRCCIASDTAVQCFAFIKVSHATELSSTHPCHRKSRALQRWTKGEVETNQDLRVCPSFLCWSDRNEIDGKPRLDVFLAFRRPGTKAQRPRIGLQNHCSFHQNVQSGPSSIPHDWTWNFNVSAAGSALALCICVSEAKRGYNWVAMKMIAAKRIFTARDIFLLQCADHHAFWFTGTSRLIRTHTIRMRELFEFLWQRQFILLNSK